MGFGVCKDRDGDEGGRAGCVFVHVDMTDGRVLGDPKYYLQEADFDAEQEHYSASSLRRNHLGSRFRSAG